MSPYTPLVDAALSSGLGYTAPVAVFTPLSRGFPFSKGWRVLYRRAPGGVIIILEGDLLAIVVQRLSLLILDAELVSL